MSTAEKPEGTVTAQVFRPEPGSQITSLLTGNTYTFGKRIGSGFFSDVYSCTDVWKNELAVKVLKPRMPLEAMREAANREFETLLTVRHPNITHVHDAFEFQSTFFIVTEQCFGDLENLFVMPSLEGNCWLMPIARCILQAVHAIHVMGLVHQDIHAGNIMTALHGDEMAPEREKVWNFKVADLGIARLHTDLAATELRKRSITPPEVLDPNLYGPLDHRIDIYHTGLLLLQIAMSKKLEFTPEEILAGKPRELALTLSPPYAMALEKALRRRVQYRTASAMELWRDLNSPAGA